MAQTPRIALRSMRATLAASHLHVERAGREDFLELHPARAQALLVHVLRDGLEHRPRGLEADGVDVGQVVGRDHQLERAAEQEVTEQNTFTFGGTWAVGLDLLPNDEAGTVAGVPLPRALFDLPGLLLHRAQLSTVHPGYPQPSPEETPAAFAFRRDRERSPGFITDVIGLLLLIPPVRSVAKKLGLFGFARWARKQNMSVVTTTYEGTTVTKVVPGDVVVGDVIRREDDTDSQGRSPDGNHPEIEPGGK